MTQHADTLQQTKTNPEAWKALIEENRHDGPWTFQTLPGPAVPPIPSFWRTARLAGLSETFADRMAAQSLAALHAKYPPADPGRNENPMTSIKLDGIGFGQLTLNEIIQLTVHDLATISVDLGPGVSFKTQSEGPRGRIVFFRDDVALLPRLADVQESLIALVAPGGKKAVHRLRGSLAGILAADPDAKASNVVAAPQWEGSRHPGEFEIPDEPVEGHLLQAVIGALYWTADGEVLRSNINGAGILGRKTTYRPEA